MLEECSFCGWKILHYSILVAKKLHSGIVYTVQWLVMQGITTANLSKQEKMGESSVTGTNRGCGYVC